jgi:hypothetical protein
MIIRILPPERGVTIWDVTGEIKVGFRGAAVILLAVMECWSMGVMGLDTQLHYSGFPLENEAIGRDKAGSAVQVKALRRHLGNALADGQGGGGARRRGVEHVNRMAALLDDEIVY